MTDLRSFVNSGSRNHVIFSRGAFPDIGFVDVGLELATFIEDIIQHRKLSMKAQDFINDLFKRKMESSEELGPFLAIKNMGILFEPLLKIDLLALINRWSQSQLLIIELGTSTIENGVFFLATTNTPEYSINIQSINFMVLTEKYNSYEIQ